MGFLQAQTFFVKLENKIKITQMLWMCWLNELNWICFWFMEICPPKCLFCASERQNHLDLKGLITFKEMTSSLEIKNILWTFAVLLTVKLKPHLSCCNSPCRSKAHLHNPAGCVAPVQPSFIFHNVAFITANPAQQCCTALFLSRFICTSGCPLADWGLSGAWIAKGKDCFHVGDGES